MKDIETINVYWEGPFTKEDILENKIDAEKYDNKATDIGLYQIYGSHPLYGSGVLVYIGRTTNRGGFQKRLQNRWVIENGNDDENVQIYLGTILSYATKLTQQFEISQIEKAEVLLINALKPAFNSSNIQSVDTKLLEQNYIVHNINNYRSLYPILSSEYFWKDRFDFEIIEKLAEKFSRKVHDKDDFYGFSLQDNDCLFIGIDYEYWNREKVPLVIGLHKESVSKEELAKFKSLAKSYSEDAEKTYCYISACDNLKNTNAIEKIEKKLKSVQAFLNKK